MRSRAFSPRIGNLDTRLMPSGMAAAAMVSQTGPLPVVGSGPIGPPLGTQSGPSTVVVTPSNNDPSMSIVPNGNIPGGLPQSTVPTSVTPVNQVGDFYVPDQTGAIA